MSSSDTVKELEDKLSEAGKKLLQPPSSVDELLPLLDQIEVSLSKVEQSPSNTTQKALSPLMNALVADELLRHADIDVKVAVASCISDITRITAPDAPYDDDKMKDIFHLFVSAFENLADLSSRSYKKRAMILETVSKVRSCVIMLDLECDELITEMFQIFFRTIRDYHPDNIFSSMETIMGLILEESEDISPELLTVLLSGVKRDSEEVPPIARKLGERVLGKCATKLKPYLMQAIKSSLISLDDYSKIVTSVCEGTLRHNNDNASREQLSGGSKPSTAASSNAIAQAAKDVEEEACQGDGDRSTNRSPKSAMSNGISETKKEGTSVKVESLEKEEHLDTDKTTSDEVTPKPEAHDLGAEKSTISESNLQETGKERGRNPSSPTKSTQSSDPSPVGGGKESVNLVDNRESHDNDSASSGSGGTCPEEDEHLGEGKDISAGEDQEGPKVATPSRSEGVADESLPENVEQPKEESLVQEETPSPELTTKTSERTIDSDVKHRSRSKKKAPSEATNKDKISDQVGISINEDGITSDSEAKPLSDSEAKPRSNSRKKAPSEVANKNKISGQTGISKNEESITNDSEAKTLSDSEVKTQSRSRKKGPTGVTNQKKSGQVGTSKNEDAMTSDSEAKTLSDSEVKAQSRSRKKASSGVTDKNKPGQVARSKNEDGITSDSEAKTLSDSEAKPQSHSRKKAPSVVTNKVKTSGQPGTSKTEDGISSDSEETPLKQLSKKMDASDDDGDGPSVKKKESLKKHQRSKTSTKKNTSKSSIKDDVKDFVSPPKSPTKAIKSDNINSKRKRTPVKASDKLVYGKNLVGSKVKVYWPEDHEFYEGVIASFDSVSKKHKVMYNDGDEEILYLRKERFQFIGDDASTDAEDEAEPASTYASPEMQKKKSKKSTDVSVKHDPSVGSSKSKLKGVASKSVKKSKDDGKTDSKSRDDTSNSVGTSEDDETDKAEPHFQKVSRKTFNDSPKTSSKSKDVDRSTPKSRSKQDSLKTSSSKSKEDNPKTAAKSKGKTPQSGNKSSANGVGKLKSSSSKGKDDVDVKEKLSDLTKTQEGTKRKLSESSKDRESESKSGKKRQRK